MEPTNDVVQLLQEIRDTEREHLAEYKRISEQILELSRTAHERSIEQYREAVEQNRASVRDAAEQNKASMKVWNALWWAITALIAICLGSLLIILQRVSALR